MKRKSGDIISMVSKTNRKQQGRSKRKRLKGKLFTASYESLDTMQRLQQSIGNRALMALLRRKGIQAKTRISRPDELAEQAADQMAKAVMQDQTLADTGQQKSSNIIQQPKVMNADIQALQGPGRPLPLTARQFFEPRLGVDLGQVRIHHDERAADFAEAIQARAFTDGRHVGFNRHEYNPDSLEGRRLLAHELAHCANSSSARHPSVIWRENGVRVRSPVLDETLMQYTAAWGAGRGRHLSREEIELARTVFGDSLDYARIRFIPSEGRGLDWRVVGNTIREPTGFNIENGYMAHTFIHELTHVWQYQHFGSSYISRSLFANLGGIIAEGSRGAAYEYRVVPGQSFFEYTVEQQAMIAQHYFIAVRTIADPSISPEARNRATRRRDERQPLIDQMCAAAPRREVDLLLIRASDVVGATGATGPAILPEPPPERRIVPLRPLISVEW